MVYGSSGVLLDAVTAEMANALSNLNADAVERILSVRIVSGVASKGRGHTLDGRSLAYAATQLATAENVTAALSELSLRELTVLRVLWRSGAAVRVGSIAPAFARLLDEKTLGECLGRLQDLALLLPVDSDRSALFVPACVRAVLLSRNGPPRPAAAVLAAYKSEDVQRITNQMGVGNGRYKKAERIDGIVEAMASPEHLRDRVAALPQLARRIFDHISTAGGSVDPWSLVQKFPELNTKPKEYGYGYYPYDLYRYGGKDSGLVLLETQGLVLRYPPDWGSQLVITDEVLTALLPPLKVSPDDLVEPAFQPVVADVHPAGGHAAPVLDMVECLQFVDELQPSLTQKGLFAKPDAKRLSRWLSVRESVYADFVFALTLQAGLLRRQLQQLSVKKKTARFLQEDELAQRSALLEAWLQLDHWRDDLGEGYLRGNDWLPSTLRYRAATVRLLAELPEGGASLASIVRRLNFRIPALLATSRAGAAVAGPPAEGWLLGVLRSLAWLGLAEPLLPPARGAAPAGLRLTPAGRALLGGRAGEVPDAAIPRTDRLIVQPTLDVLAPPNIEPAVYRSLRSFTEPVSAGGMRTARLSMESLRRGVDAGTKPSTMRDFLAQYGGSLPGTIVALIADVEAKYGRIHVGHASAYLTVDDPHLLVELQADRRLEGLIERVIAPTVALVRAEGLSVMLDRLRAAGHMPMLDAETRPSGPPTLWGQTAPALGPIRFPTSTRGIPMPAVASNGLEVDAEADDMVFADDARVLPFQGRVPAGGSATATAIAPSAKLTDREEISDLLYQALESGARMEIDYRSKVQGRERRTTRTIDPVSFDGSHLMAYCYMRQTDCEFKLERIESARLTGERNRFS